MMGFRAVVEISSRVEMCEAKGPALHVVGCQMHKAILAAAEDF